MHDDSCDLDDWSNYHQRLNKRYDSGYKSLEQQLSSSLEGGALLLQDQATNTHAANPLRATTSNTNSAKSHNNTIPEQPERPKSGCSRLLIESDLEVSNLLPIALDSKSLLDEQELLLLRKSPSQKCISTNLISSHDESQSGRESKCSILSEHSAKMQIALGLNQEHQEALMLMGSEDRQHLLRSSNDDSTRDLIMVDHCERTSGNSSRSSNEFDTKLTNEAD